MRSHIVIRATNTTDKKVKAALLDPFDIIENKQKIPGVEIEGTVSGVHPIRNLKVMLSVQIVKVTGIKYRQTLLRPLKLSENPPRTAKRTKSIFAESYTSYGVRGVLAITSKRDDAMILLVTEEEYWNRKQFFLGAQTKNEHIFSAIWAYVPAHTSIKYTITIETPDPIDYLPKDNKKLIKPLTTNRHRYPRKVKPGAIIAQGAQGTGKKMTNKTLLERNSAKLKEREELLRWQIPGYYIHLMCEIYELSFPSLAKILGISSKRLNELRFAHSNPSVIQTQFEKTQLLKAMNINSFMDMVKNHQPQQTSTLDCVQLLKELEGLKSDAKKIEALRNEFNIN